MDIYVYIHCGRTAHIAPLPMCRGQQRYIYRVNLSIYLSININIYIYIYLYIYLYLYLSLYTHTHIYIYIYIYISGYNPVMAAPPTSPRFQRVAASSASASTKRGSRRMILDASISTSSNSSVKRV